MHRLLTRAVLTLTEGGVWWLVDGPGNRSLTVAARNQAEGGLGCDARASVEGRPVGQTG